MKLPEFSFFFSGFYFSTLITGKNRLKNRYKKFSIKPVVLMSGLQFFRIIVQLYPSNRVFDELENYPLISKYQKK